MAIGKWDGLLRGSNCCSSPHPLNLVGARRRRECRHGTLRALLHAGFQFDPESVAHGDSGNASRRTIYRLPYTPLVTGAGALRLESQIGTAVWPLRLPSVERSWTSFWAAAFWQPPEVLSIPCVALVETITEKFVALTGRAGAELAEISWRRDILVSLQKQSITQHAHHPVQMPKVWPSNSQNRYQAAKGWSFG